MYQTGAVAAHQLFTAVYGLNQKQSVFQRIAAFVEKFKGVGGQV